MWDYIKEWKILPLGGKVDGNPRVGGIGPCGCEWQKSWFVEDCFSRGKLLFTRTADALINIGETAITKAWATGEGCPCLNPDGVLQPWVRNPRGGF